MKSSVFSRFPVSCLSETFCDFLELRLFGILKDTRTGLFTKKKARESSLLQAL